MARKPLVRGSHTFDDGVCEFAVEYADQHLREYGRSSRRSGRGESGSLPRLISDEFLDSVPLAKPPQAISGLQPIR
jgi:hypothetical protein